MDGEDPTQATQNVLDPRRLGKQNSGFSDDDVSDIICVLYPHSAAARREVQRLAREDSPYIIGKDEADVVEPDYELEDHASRFASDPVGRGNYAVILRLSAQVKSPAAGFAFGRNAARCDVVFVNDPRRRISNIHFRIYVNEYGTVMLEDQSTNGTVVDDKHLKYNPKSGSSSRPAWALSSGFVIKIILHHEGNDLVFRVRIPRRDDEYERAYAAKVDDYFARHGLRATPNPAPPLAPPPPPPHHRTSGHVDLFGTPGHRAARAAAPDPTPPDEPVQSSLLRRKKVAVPKEWTGSGRYNKTGTIGKGAFAVVYKVTAKYDGKPYAAKELDKRRFVKNGVLDQKVENEMKIMRRVHHPNIVQYMENIEWENRLLIIIMEYVPGGDLGKLILDDGPFPEDMAQTVAKQLLSALGYLHTNNITHRDVKPDNILINTTEPLEVKLTDFGLSKMIETEQTFLRTFCGTLLYCAPEVYTEYAEYDDNGIRNRGKKMRRVPGQRYSHAVDIWSLGGVLFYTLTGSPPYPVTSGISYSELLHRIMTTTLDMAPLQKYRVSEQGIDSLHRMLQRRPEKRATIAELKSHAWLAGDGSGVRPWQSHDEITDDEDDVVAELSQPPPAAYEADQGYCVSDSMSGESEKENSNVTQAAQPTHQPRLFGKVGVSAIGSSGVIAADYFNPPPPAHDTSMGETEMLNSDDDGAYESGDSDTVRGRGRNRQPHRYTTTSVYPNQSPDQLQSLVEDVASQSLGGKDAPPAPGTSSHYSSHSMDSMSSKRKPPSHETSDEFGESTPPGKPIIKRLKSDGDDDVAEDVVGEFKLLACVPQIKRLSSGRQIDSPVSKMTFWEQDRKTWHLRYPEMTQLQYDAFSQAARGRGEEFGPGKTPLWDLAMKYFSPSRASWDPDGCAAPGGPPGPGPKRDDAKTADDSLDFPSTAPPVDAGPRGPRQTQHPDTQIVVPDPASIRALAVLESHAESCIQGISFAVTDSFASFGRGLDNTEVFGDRMELRIPKYAFKLMLWNEGYDPARDPAKAPHPWQGASSPDDDTYHFWMSTKATLGVRINGYTLASSDAKNPGGPSQHWTRVHDGDVIMVWGGQDPENQTKLVLRCLWGGSAMPHPGDRRQLALASPALVAKLNAACAQTERRIRETAEKRRRLDEADAQHQERLRQVDRERKRSRAFEERRREAVEYLAAVPCPAERRPSPASVLSATGASRLQATMHSSRLGHR